MIFQVVAPMLLLAGSPWLPESPRFLIYNGLNDAGLDVLQKLHRAGANNNNVVALEEFVQIRDQVALDRHNEVSWLDLWKRPNTRKRLAFGFFVIAAAQSSGVLVGLPG